MPSQRLIVYTRPDGGVSVCAPSLTALRYMTHGGGRWDGCDPGFIDRQIEAQSAHGVGERAARQFVLAMHKGGCTDAEAYAIMRDRFCAPHGSAFEIVEDLPHDRWFRNAWRRNHNGGPIGVDMKTARRIQYRRITQAGETAKASLQLGRWKDRLRLAKTPEDLRRIWPEGLKHG